METTKRRERISFKKEVPLFSFFFWLEAFMVLQFLTTEMTGALSIHSLLFRIFEGMDKQSTSPSAPSTGLPFDRFNKAMSRIVEKYKFTKDDFRSVPKVRLFLGNFLLKLISVFTSLKPEWKRKQAKSGKAQLHR